MSTVRHPGRLCPTRKVHDIRDGTSCKATMHKPGHACSQRKPVGGHVEREVAFLEHWAADVRWHRTEAKAIYRELHLEISAQHASTEGHRESKSGESQDSLSSMVKKNVKDAALDPAKALFLPTKEGAELRSDLLGFLKKGAMVVKSRGKLAERIRGFLNVSALKGKSSRRVFEVLKRDIKEFGVKHLKDMAKGFAVGMFLDWSQSFIMKSAEEQMNSARTPAERNASLFLAADAIVLKAGSNIVDFSFWWGVAKDLKGSYRAGKMKSVSGAWDAWSDAVTRDHESGEAKAPKMQLYEYVPLRLPIRVFNQEIGETMHGIAAGKTQR